MNDRYHARPPPTPFGGGRPRRVAFAVTLVALPLVAPLLSDSSRDAGTLEPAAPAGLRAPPAAPTASVFGNHRPSAAPDHALLDASDVRRALPAQSPAVAGMEHTTL